MFVFEAKSPDSFQNLSGFFWLNRSAGFCCFR